MMDVAFKILIDNVELVDNKFKLLNIVFDVAFELLIDNIELVDNIGSSKPMQNLHSRFYSEIILNFRVIIIIII